MVRDFTQRCLVFFSPRGKTRKHMMRRQQGNICSRKIIPRNCVNVNPFSANFPFSCLLKTSDFLIFLGKIIFKKTFLLESFQQSFCTVFSRFQLKIAPPTDPHICRSLQFVLWSILQENRSLQTITHSNRSHLECFQTEATAGGVSLKKFANFTGKHLC